MLWAIRGTDRYTQQDITIVLEAESQSEAEYMARRRQFPLVVVEPATPEEVQTARAQKRLFGYRAPSPYVCMGQPVGRWQLACLMLSGLATIAVLLRSGQFIP